MCNTLRLLHYSLWNRGNATLEPWNVEWKVRITNRQSSILHWNFLVTVIDASSKQFCRRLGASLSLLEGNVTCFEAFWNLLEPTWESFGPSQGGRRWGRSVWWPKSMILESILESKMEAKFGLDGSTNFVSCGDQFIIRFWSMLLSKIKAVRRQCRPSLIGMSNVFAHCGLLKTTVIYSSFWR